MPDLWMDVDVALAEVPVNIMPLIDDTDFKTIEDAVAYNAAGMALRWHFITCAGAYTVTSVTPTTGGDYDWTDQGDSGIYTIEIPASGGASINNDTEGFGWFTGKATGVLPWRGPTIGFRRAALNDLLIEGGTASTNLEDFFDGTGYAGGTAKLTVDAVKWLGQTIVTPVNNGVPKVDLTQVLGTALVTGADTAFNNFAKMYQALEMGTAQAGGASTITLRGGAPASNDLILDQAIWIMSGTGAGQTNHITDYDGATKVATVATPWVTQPDNTSAYVVLGRIG